MRRLGGLLGLALVLALPATASGATVFSSPARDFGCIKGICDKAPPMLTFDAASGEANRVTLTRQGDVFTVRDEGAPLSARDGCEQVAPDTARCAQPGAVVSVRLGDADDVASTPMDHPVALDGGAGADRLTGGSRADTLNGGDGPDALLGGPGDDSLDGDGFGPGAADDSLDGGEGTDRVTYFARQVPLVASLASGTAGQAGERDALVAIEGIVGGQGDDTITGDAGPNRLDGWLGDDRVIGGDGGDELTGYEGADQLEAGPGDDQIDGLEPRAAGSCGDGIDRVEGLAFPTFLHSDCERVMLGAFLTPEPMLSVRPVGRTARALRYVVACPAGDFACRLDVDVRTADRREVRIARAGRSLPKGYEGRVSLPLTKAGRRLLRKRCPRLHVILRRDVPGSGWVIPKGPSPVWCRSR